MQIRDPHAIDEQRAEYVNQMKMRKQEIRSAPESSRIDAIGSAIGRKREAACAVVRSMN